MSIPESVVRSVNAASVDSVSLSEAEATARRVILALAENLPESAVDAGCDAVDKIVGLGGDTDRDVVRATIIAALKEVAGETP
jgi:ribosomal 50S subunit-associated protein YjgA (DUF615 family)